MHKQIEDEGNVELKNKAKIHYISVLKQVLEKRLNKESSNTNSTILFTPLICFGTNRLKLIKSIKRERNLQYLIQMNFILEDLKTPNVFELGDRNIDKNTMSFVPNIVMNLYYFAKECNKDSLLNINQFLYLINSNYYEKIKKEYPNLNRNRLVNIFMNRIGALLPGKITKFDEEDAKRVLKTLPIKISSKVKEEILNEYIEAKTKDPVSGNYDFKILRKDITADELSTIYKRYFKKEFSKDNIEDYNKLINDIEVSIGESLRYKIENNWDVETLKNISNYIIDHYENILTKQYPNFSHIGLVSSFIYQLIDRAIKTCNNDITSNEIYSVVVESKVLPTYIRKDVEEKFSFNKKESSKKDFTQKALKKVFQINL